MWIVWIMVCLAAYLIGSIPVAYILVKKAQGIDVREVGSGNVGTTNSFRAAGKTTGFLVFGCDVLKGLIPTWAAFVIDGNALALLAGICMLLGHIFPVWLQFKGGKGVAVTLGAGLALVPLLAVISLLCFGLVLVLSGYVSVGSCVGVLMLALLCLFTGQHWLVTLMFFIFAIVVLIRHKNNLIKVANGQEERMVKLLYRNK